MNTARFLKTQMKVAPLIGRRDYDKALRILEGELAGTSDDAAYLEMIANCHLWTGNEEKAIETAKKVMVLDPNNFEMPRMLSQIFVNRGDHEQAAVYVRNGVDNFPSEPTPPPPSWMLSVLRLAARFSARWKRIEETTNKELREPDKDRREWRAWANDYLTWYENEMKK